ncbi:MAG: DUF885 domain-containing protein [Pseudomonadota bacterium]
MSKLKLLVRAAALCGAMLGAMPAHALTSAPIGAAAVAAQRLDALAARYYLAQAHFDPMSATINGDNRFDGELTLTLEPAVRARQFAMLHQSAAALGKIERAALAPEQQITYDCLAYELKTALAFEAFPDNLLPISQMDSIPVLLAKFGSGLDSQPLTSVAQYQLYLHRIALLPRWLRAARANMRTGMARGVVQPKALMVALLPQLKALAGASVESSDYAAPIRHFPAQFSSVDKARLDLAYRTEVERHILPALRSFAAFVEHDYLPAARASSGWGDLPNGAAWYRAWTAAQTASTLTPDAIHRIGLAEMERITGEFARMAPKLGYSGEPLGLARWLAAQPQYRPFHSDEEVLEAYRAIERKVAPRLPELFATLPAAQLAIRAEPELTRDAASDHYSAAAVDGSRPGTFWAVITDPAKYADTKMTTLFLHEAKPGHHFQISKQLEMRIPDFRKFSANNAYVEGWALYAETLGHELGVFDDPNAYVGHLMSDLRRATRLVVDTGLHAKGWSREQTIAFLVEKSGESEEKARNSTERYMAWPGQSLGYKIGALKIIELRQRASTALGPKFSLARFHDAVLANGPLPLALLESQIDAWIAQQAKL